MKTVTSTENERKDIMLHRVYGQLTDFNGNPQVGGVVCIKDAQMNDVYLTHTDSNGCYTIDVREGNYVGLGAVKDYAESKLEYWCWELPVYDDMEINMQIDGIEVYGMNAFLIQRSSAKSPLMIYFRPMSLNYYKKNSSSFSDDSVKDMNVFPPLSLDDICVTVNKQKAKVIEMSKISERPTDKEYADKSICGYLLQIGQEGIDWSSPYQKIEVIISSGETGEKGAGCLYWKTPESYRQ